MSAIAVVGGGIAGLTVAHQLSAGHDVVVFEREPTAGGKIRSQPIDGCLFELGPSGFLSSADDLRALVGEIGLGEALIEAAPAAKNRFIYWDGKLHKLPSKPPEILRMSLLSRRGKLRALRELFIPSRDPAGAAEDESVYGFVERRFGREVAERIATPALLGISGGNAAGTSLAAVFPRLPNLEREHGSIIRGMMRGGGKPARMCSFSGGMQRLTDRLAERLGPRLRLGSKVTRIERDDAGWRIAYGDGDMVVDGVVIATPADITARLVAGFDSELAAQLHCIPYAPMRAIGVAYRSVDVPAPLDGFGFLAARGCGVRILGATYTSTIMPEQAPAETAYLRIFMGGAADPAAGTLSAQAARTVALGDIASVLGITAAPLAYHEVVWPRAIPQYGLGHRAAIEVIEERSLAHPGLALAGNAYRGLGVGDTVRDARTIATRIATTWKR